MGFSSFRIFAVYFFVWKPHVIEPRPDLREAETFALPAAILQSINGGPRRMVKSVGILFLGVAPRPVGPLSIEQIRNPRPDDFIRLIQPKALQRVEKLAHRLPIVKRDGF